ncbi:hypothetical protein MRB53_041406 [Persea americana]|nr:hypothetical protein MRB53_041406 [Persea americana]
MLSSYVSNGRPQCGVPSRMKGTVVFANPSLNRPTEDDMVVNDELSLVHHKPSAEMNTTVSSGVSVAGDVAVVDRLLADFGKQVNRRSRSLASSDLARTRNRVDG